jgi:hypothetical protein
MKHLIVKLRCWNILTDTNDELPDARIAVAIPYDGNVKPSMFNLWMFMEQNPEFLNKQISTQLGANITGFCYDVKMNKTKLR